MSTHLSDAARIYRGLSRLILLDRSAVDLLAGDAVVLRRSFIVPLACLPLFLMLAAPAGLRPLARDLGQYSLDWTIYPLLAWGAASLAGARPRWCSLVAAMNWLQGAEWALAGAVTALGLTVPGPLAAAGGLAALACQFLLARRLLGLGAPAAAALTLADLALSVALTRLFDLL